MTLEELKSGYLFLVDKPLEWSSFDVVRKLKGITRAKIGHGGTLDPLATGLMLVATGSFTKKLTSLQELSKEYTGAIFLGASRPSFDKETEIDQEWDISHISEADIFATALKLTGVIEQAPPAFSAIKVDGVRSYKLAHKGEIQEMKLRTQEIFEFEITAIELPYIQFRINCSKGTYIRSLASDFGKILGVGAYLDQLTRTKIGEYSLTDAWKLESLVDKIFELKREERNENIQGS